MWAAAQGRLRAELDSELLATEPTQLSSDLLAVRVPLGSEGTKAWAGQGPSGSLWGAYVSLTLSALIFPGFHTWPLW